MSGKAQTTVGRQCHRSGVGAVSRHGLQQLENLADLLVQTVSWASGTSLGVNLVEPAPG